MCVCVAVSLHCTAETNVAKCSYSNFQKHSSAITLINDGFDSVQLLSRVRLCDPTL